MNIRIVFDGLMAMMTMVFRVFAFPSVFQRFAKSQNVKQKANFSKPIDPVSLWKQLAHEPSLSTPPSHFHHLHSGLEPVSLQPLHACSHPVDVCVRGVQCNSLPVVQSQSDYK